MYWNIYLSFKCKTTNNTQSFKLWSLNFISFYKTPSLRCNIKIFYLDSMWWFAKLYILIANLFYLLLLETNVLTPTKRAPGGKSGSKKFYWKAGDLMSLLGMTHRTLIGFHHHCQSIHIRDSGPVGTGMFPFGLLCDFRMWV